MSKTLRTVGMVVGLAALAVVTYGASIGPTAAAAAGSAGIGAMSVTGLGTVLSLTAGTRSVAAATELVTA